MAVANSLDTLQSKEQPKESTFDPQIVAGFSYSLIQLRNSSFEQSQVSLVRDIVWGMGFHPTPLLSIE